MSMPRRIAGRIVLSLMTAALFAIPVAAAGADQPLSLKLRKREKSDKNDAVFVMKEETVRWKPQQTAIVIVDMWDNHHCKAAAKRVVEMAPHMNRVVAAARKRGVTIIHAPSSCMEFYAESPARRNVLSLPKVTAPTTFQWNHFNADREGPLAAKFEEAGCSCDSDQPCGPSFRAWKRQIAAIEIADQDAVSDNGQEVFNVLQDRGIENVIIMGVHTNRCVLGRPFGIRQMVYLGKNVVLCRDLTDSYHRDPGRHFEGLQTIVGHVEKYWCPTITSTNLSGEPAFRFKADKTNQKAETK